MRHQQQKTQQRKKTNKTKEDFRATIIDPHRPTTIQTDVEDTEGSMETGIITAMAEATIRTINRRQTVTVVPTTVEEATGATQQDSAHGEEIIITSQETTTTDRQEIITNREAVGLPDLAGSCNGLSQEERQYATSVGKLAIWIKNANPIYNATPVANLVTTRRSVSEISGYHSKTCPNYSRMQLLTARAAVPSRFKSQQYRKSR